MSNSGMSRDVDIVHPAFPLSSLQDAQRDSFEEAVVARDTRTMRVSVS